MSLPDMKLVFVSVTQIVYFMDASKFRWSGR